MIDVLVKVPGGSYPVYIGDSILSSIGQIVTKHCSASAYIIISDTAVSHHYAAIVSASLASFAPCTVLDFPPGESSKTRDTWINLTDQMIAAGIGRDAAIVALGGGVAGDLAGFVAATYHRGIDYIQVPTSLLAMVDSSVGGKTGVDTQLGKNLVGAFHQPKLVFADTVTLRTLSAEHFRAGMAEAIKHGAISDREYFESLRDGHASVLARDSQTLLNVVRRSVEIKAGVVSEDEREAGIRAILNFGHSVAHGIETVSDYSLLHGEAVAIGMCIESQMGEAMGVTDPGTTDQLRQVLGLFGLPTTPPPNCHADPVIAAARRDKKNRAGIPRFTAIKRIGQAAQTKPDSWTTELPDDVLRTALSQDSLS